MMMIIAMACLISASVMILCMIVKHSRMYRQRRAVGVVRNVTAELAQAQAPVFDTDHMIVTGGTMMPKEVTVVLDKRSYGIMHQVV